MSEIASIAATIFKRAAKAHRYLVAIAGPPGSGKSTLAAALRDLLPDGTAEVVAMDGFHYDDLILNRRGLLTRKGAPETFDFAGFEILMKRIKAGEPDVAVPVFDRAMELSRAGASVISSNVKFVLVEGNYLMLDEEPWSRLGELFDLSIFVDADRTDLEHRLLSRWREHGKSDDDARARVTSNDMPNADRVSTRRRKSDLTFGNRS